jgi:hypothetical protein
MCRAVIVSPPPPPPPPPPPAPAFAEQPDLVTLTIDARASGLNTRPASIFLFLLWLSTLGVRVAFAEAFNQLVKCARCDISCTSNAVGRVNTSASINFYNICKRTLIYN